MDLPPFELAVMGVLLALSALFSASETALFSLTAADERRASARALALSRRPRELLVALMLGNLVVNTLFFAFAASLSAGREGWDALLLNVGALLVLVLVGEVLPKTLALGARLFFARVVAVPLSLMALAVRPVIRVIDRLLELMYRALGPAGREELGITSEALGHALEKSAERGLLLDTEASILAGLVELSEVRVREVMTPRVDMLFLDVDGTDRHEVVERALQSKTRWIVVIDGAPDQILGRVRLRDLLAQPERSARELLEPVIYVPEVATAMHVLQWLREKRVAEAIVVDEWGGTAGLVRLEHIFEEILGDLRVEGESSAQAVVPRGEGHFEVDGSLSIRDWNEYFGHRVVPREFATVGGFVTALLGHIPRTADVVRAGSLVFVVREVRRRRVTRIEVFVDRTHAAEVPGVTGFLILLGLAACLVLSGLFSGSEIGLYSLSRARVEGDARGGDRTAKIILALLRNESWLLVTLLLANSAVTQLATLLTSRAIEPLGVPADFEELLVALLVAPPFVLLGEIFPKDLFRRRPHALVGICAPVIALVRTLLAPVTLPLVWLTSLLSRMFGFDQEELTRVHGREAVIDLLAERDEELLPHVERMARNALELRSLRVERVMVPWRKVEVLRTDTEPQAARRQLASTAFARLPVVDARGAVRGYVHQLEVLGAPQRPPLDLLRPMIAIEPDTPLDRTLARLRATGQRAAIVGSPAKPFGLVTLKDLVEEISGELARW